MGVISEDDIMNQAAVNALINNSSTTNAPLTSITLPSGAPSNDRYYHIFIYPSAWGTPSAGVGLGPLSEAGISNPTGYGAFFLCDPKSNAGAVLNITWSNN